MPAGRPPAGPAIAFKLEGSDVSKQRLNAILATVAGQTTVDAASAQIGLCPARFYTLRDRALQAAVARLEPRAGGRPRKEEPSAEQVRIRELEARVERLERELLAAEVRAQTGLLLPRRDPSTAAAGPAKKKSRSRPRRATRRATRRR